MYEVRNREKKLLGIMDEKSGVFEISIKGCVTLIKFPPGTKIEIVKPKKTA
jgi:hypothetical protein